MQQTTPTIRTKRWFLHPLSWVVLLLGSLLLVGQSCVPTDKPPSSFQQSKAAIVNGAPSLAHPALGTLMAGGASFCSGALIGPKAVLTAAHCMEGSTFRSKQAAFRIDLPLDHKRFRAVTALIDQSKSVPHPKYTQQENSAGLLLKLENDIGIVALKAPIHGVSYPPINTKTIDNTWVGKQAFIWGYGKTSFFTSLTSPEKLYSVLTITSVGTSIAGRAVPNSLRLESKTNSPCQGDSGSSYLMELDGVLKIVAVHSFGNARCVGSEGAFRTDPYASWIQTTLEKVSGCQTDSDCGTCGSCKNKACQPKTNAALSSHCQPCRTDKDCENGACVQLKSGRRCLQRCDKGCCPSGTLCNQAEKPYCFPETDACPDVACQKDEDCSDIESCLQGTCTLKLPPPASNLCQPCNKHEDCGEGGFCHTPVQTGGRCLQSCSAQGLCPKGFACQALAPRFERCVPRDRLCNITCKDKQDCLDSWNCEKGICLRSSGANVGEPCSEQQPCRKELTCIQTAEGSRCFQACGYPLGSAGAPCFLSSGGGFGCKPGLECISNPLGGRICVQSCGRDADCTKGGTCLPLFNFCICREDSACGKDKTCKIIAEGIGACNEQKVTSCPADHTCQQDVSSGACLPKVPGTQGHGQTCSVYKRCREGLDCVPGINVCAEPCTDDDVCKLGGSCQAVPLLLNKYCLCEQDKSCRKNWQCRTFTQLLSFNISVCVPGYDAGCQVNDQCHNDLVCHGGACLFSSDIPEPSPEPEPSSEDAGTGAESTTESNSPGPPEGNACGCQTNEPGVGGLWGILFLALLVCLRRFK